MHCVVKKLELQKSATATICPASKQKLSKLFCDWKIIHSIN